MHQLLVEYQLIVVYQLIIFRWLMQGMTRPSIHSTGNFVYKHVYINFLAGGQARAVEWMESGNLPVCSPLQRNKLSNMLLDQGIHIYLRWKFKLRSVNLVVHFWFILTKILRKWTSLVHLDTKTSVGFILIGFYANSTTWCRKGMCTMTREP